MTDTTEISIWLLLWLLGVLAVIQVQRSTRRPGAAIAVSYLLSMTLAHWVGATTYLWAGTHLYDPADVLTGLKVSTGAVLAFAAGFIFVSPILRSRDPSAQTNHFQVHPRLPEVYLVAGVFFYSILFSPLGNVPSLRAVGSAGQELLTVGLCLICWRAVGARKARGIGKWICLALLLPFFTIVFQGFLGYGFGPFLILIVFLSTFLRYRATYVVAALVIGYLGLSVFVSYAQNRPEIREVVTNGQPLINRAEVILGEKLHFELLDLGKQSHRDHLDARLNQNHLVGTAVRRLEVTGDFAGGKTFWEAAQAIVPRFLWPGKPVTAGSGDVVASYTGLRFAPGTSVAVGHVLELYINFGLAAVILGFVLLGTLLGGIDRIASSRLVTGDWQGFALYYLVGVGFIRAGGSLVETVATVSASIALALVMNRLLLARLQKDRPLHPPTRAMANTA